MHSGGVFREFKKEPESHLEPEAMQMRQIKIKTDEGKKRSGWKSAEPGDRDW